MKHLPELDPATSRFFGLTPDHVLDAVDKAGLHATGQFQQLNSLENRVFSVQVEPEGLARLCPDCADAAADLAPERVIVKIYRPGRWNREQIEAEHGFLADLAQAGFPVVQALAADPQSGSGTVGEDQGMFHAIWPCLGGRIPDEFNDAMLDSFGRLLARLHDLGEAKTAPSRNRIDAATLIRRPLAFLEENSLVPAQVWPRYREAALVAADALDRTLPGMPVHRIHGDCHWGNLLARGDVLHFLDFDDFATGPAVQDLWMIAPAQDEDGMRQRALVLEAYRRVRPFKDEWLSAINPLKAGRYIHYAAWIARRWADPAFPLAFPQFGDLEYWETEARDLEQLIQRGFDPVATGGTVALPAEDYSHLTNKDYFFDM